MDYYGKYIKYKKKYLELSNNKMHSSLNELKSNDTLKLIPKKSVSKNYIKLEFPNINVSQCEYSEGPVGLTFIKFNKGAKVHMEIRGGWPGYINCLSTNEKQIINGINIAGGSLLGLESTTGLTIESLKNNNYTNFEGYNGAIIYSNNLNNNKIYPDKDLGRFACNQNDDKLFNGQVGAGLSASHGQGWRNQKVKYMLLKNMLNLDKYPFTYDIIEPTPEQPTLSFIELIEIPIPMESVTINVYLVPKNKKLNKEKHYAGSSFHFGVNRNIIDCKRCAITRVNFKVDIDKYVEKNNITKENINNYDIIIEGEGKILNNSYKHEDLLKDGLIHVKIDK